MSGDTFDFDQGGRETLRGTLHLPQTATAGDVLTVQADKSIAAAPGGGSGGVQVVTVPVSSAQILDLFNTPVVLIPGVAGSLIVVNGVMFAYVAGATPYTDNGGAIIIGLAGLGGTIGLAGAGFWDQATSQIYEQGYGDTGSNSAAAVDGVDMVLSEDTANPTGGDGTLLVTVSYFLAPTA